MTGGGSASAEAAWNSYCALKAQAVVQKAVQCAVVSLHASVAVTAELEAWCRQSRVPALAAGRVGLDLSKCISPLTCSSMLGLGCGGDREFVGLVPRGGSCYSSQECDQGARCDLGSTCPGRCVARIAVGQPVAVRGSLDGDGCVEGAHDFNGICEADVPIGQQCGGLTNSTCAERGVCDRYGECRRLGVRGGPCADSNACQPGLSCAAGSCTEYPDLNEPCATFCKSGLVCMMGTCQRPGPIGTRCTSSFQCERGLACSGDPVTPGTCRSLKRVGEGCVFDSDCEPGLLCGTNGGSAPGLCRAPAAVGAACWQGDCAKGSYCTSLNPNTTGVCAAHKPVGASCPSGAECAGECLAGRCSCVDPAL